MATLQPSATSCRTSSRPIPVPPPVTTAILSAKSFIVCSSRACALRLACFIPWQRLPCLEQYGGDEERAFRVTWAAVTRRYCKRGSDWVPIKNQRQG